MHNTRRCCDVESTSMTLIQRRSNVVCQVGCTYCVTPLRGTAHHGFQLWANVGQSSVTLAQHYLAFGSTSCTSGRESPYRAIRCVNQPARLSHQGVARPPGIDLCLICLLHSDLALLTLTSNPRCDPRSAKWQYFYAALYFLRDRLCSVRPFLLRCVV